MTDNQIDNLVAAIWDDFMTALPEGTHDEVNDRICPDEIRYRIEQALKDE
jgi:hypothetical protein